MAASSGGDHHRRQRKVLGIDIGTSEAETGHGVLMRPSHPSIGITPSLATPILGTIKLAAVIDQPAETGGFAVIADQQAECASSAKLPQCRHGRRAESSFVAPFGARDIRKMDPEEIWRIREEDIYPTLFGTTFRGIFPLSAELFSRRFGQQDVDPRWLFYGIIEFAPTEERPCWLYATSGNSNPWDWDDGARQDEPGKNSGAGVEFLFASTQQGNWAITYLQNMLAFDILLSAGRFPGRGPLVTGDRIPLRAPINGRDECIVRNAIISHAQTLSSGFVLPSGRVDFLTFTGVTDNEISFAKANGTPDLIERLLAAGAHPITDPARTSII